MKRMFELLKEGLGDIIDHQKGKKKLRRRISDVPEPAASLFKMPALTKKSLLYVVSGFPRSM